jgi:hypothetical protein
MRLNTQFSVGFGGAAGHAIRAGAKRHPTAPENQNGKADSGLLAGPRTDRSTPLHLGKIFDSFLLRRWKPLCNVLGLHRPAAKYSVKIRRHRQKREGMHCVR